MSEYLCAYVYGGFSDTGSSMSPEQVVGKKERNTDEIAKCDDVETKNTERVED